MTELTDEERGTAAEIDRLQETILQATIAADADAAVILHAMKRVIVFWMARSCPDCRRRIARELKADLPSMLNAAAQLRACSTRR